MEEDTLKKIEEQFGSEWNCLCGGSFESARVEVVSKTKDTALARYSCQICGREQMFTVPVDLNKEADKTLVVEVPEGAITSDDVLDIKKETANASAHQIKASANKKTAIGIRFQKSLTAK